MRVCGETSDWLAVNGVVRQGTVLGQILFLNDLATHHDQRWKYVDEYTSVSEAINKPFQNTYQKGIFSSLGQTRYYTPDENGGLFRWTDPLTTITFSLRSLGRSPRYPHVLFVSLYIRILSFPWFYVITRAEGAKS